MKILSQNRIIAIYSTVVSTLYFTRKLETFIFRATAGSEKIKFREFSSEIKDFTTVEYVVLFNEADSQDTF